MNPRIVQTKIAFRIFAVATLLGVLIGCSSHPSAAQMTPPPPTEADKAFEAGAKRPPTAKTMFALEQILATQGKDAEAQMVCEQIIRDHPEFIPAYCDLAEAHMRQRHIQEAMRVLNVGLQRAPNEVILVNDVGMCHLLIGDYAGAVRAFTRASGMAPDEPRYRSNLAMTLGLLGRYDESLSLYMHVMLPADAHYNLAVLCDARHDTARAKVEYQKAAALGGLDAQRQSNAAPSLGTRDSTEAGAPAATRDPKLE
ncbi:MAG: bacteriophage receptor, outer rane subunit [Phycisphaerales bacterium]|nr:bacteriophage receptor, outer rane subunit [Phycisphaerales bacterium]